jgi:hypothetical protein
MTIAIKVQTRHPTRLNTFIRGARGVLLLFFMGSFVLACKGQEPSDQQAASRSLELSAKDLVSVLEKGDSQAFLAMMSRRGIVFGLEPPPISLANIQKQFRKRKGAYCILFDSVCLRKEDAAARKRAGAPALTEPLRSYRDLLGSFPKRKIQVFVEPLAESWAGRIVVSFDREPSDTDTSNLEPLEFLLIREGGGWKITAIVYS